MIAGQGQLDRRNGGLEIVRACSLMRRDSARSSVPASGRRCATSPVSNDPRPDRNFGPSAGMLWATLSNFQLRSHDCRIRASEYHRRQISTAGLRHRRDRPVGVAYTLRACNRPGLRTPGNTRHRVRGTTWLRLQKTLFAKFRREQPSEISLNVFRGQLNHSVNRRRYWPFPTVGRRYGFRLTNVLFSPNPSGPKNEAATVVVLRNTDDGRPLGILWHYTCHPTAVVSATRHQRRLPRNGTPRTAGTLWRDSMHLCAGILR